MPYFKMDQVRFALLFICSKIEIIKLLLDKKQKYHIYTSSPTLSVPFLSTLNVFLCSLAQLGL